MSHPPYLDPLLSEGHELAAQLLAALRHSHQQSRQTKAHLRQWRAQAKPASANSDTTALMMSSLLGGLFGLPIFDSLNPSIAQGLQAAVLMDGATDRPSHRSGHSYQLDRDIEATYTELFQAFLSEQTAQQKSLKRQKKLVMLAMLAMLMEDDTEEAPELIAGDALRRPSYARFKQNRHSMDCIREAFQRQANSVTAPSFNAPRYRMAG